MERAKRKSYNVASVEYKQEKFRIDVDKLKKLLITSAATVAIAASVLTGVVVKGTENLQDNIAIKEYLSQYQDIVYDNTHRTDNGQYYWYDTERMEREISNDPETFDEELYAVYGKIGYNDDNKIKHMDQIVRYTGEYKNFDDFLIKNGFVDKNGEPSRENYEEYMDAYILAKANMSEVEQSRKK